MHDELILKAAKVMNEQASAYGRLQVVVNQLSAALVRGEPGAVESITRAGESELLRMRSCLLEVTSCLTKFTEAKSAEKDKTPLDAETREQFEKAAQLLVKAAKDYQTVALRAASLAQGGSAFVSACVQTCGIPPMTYRAPVLKYQNGGQPGEY